MKSTNKETSSSLNWDPRFNSVKPGKSKKAKRLMHKRLRRSVNEEQ